ncbi:hypothetical protein [Lederbergia panacisoli]|uniref:hypothetical protein n=1 Tax=Lederbergia panacisoli TaxID=1255251 RepID=UPI00214B93E5|nr:hypothetical protein [Lederbergia panacisoli]MCR2821755.1 hypothetical protein [Lederbergia panacisoli]
MKGFIFRVSEIVLGLVFLCAGLNGYFVLFGFNPIFPTSPKAMEFLGTGYLLVLEKTPEIICGILLLIRRFIPLALTILAPIIINILAFHIFVDHALLPLALLLILIEVMLIWKYRKNFMGLLN